MKTLKIKRDDAVLVVIDMQEKLVPAMKDSDNLASTVAKLIKGCRILGVPVILSQQYTKGLGETIPEIREMLGTEDPDTTSDYYFVEKTCFSCHGEESFSVALEDTGKRTVLVCGIESHVCVQQTVIDLIEDGYNVFLINDCIASRNNTDKKFAQRRMGDSGAIGTTYEAALFEMCADAKAPEFKAISTLVK